MKGHISNIQRFSLNDGPGIRTTVFFSGCPLRCQWCANPETWEPRPQDSLMTSNEIMDSLQKDIIFYEESGGGITFSGGEPTLQKELLLEIIEKAEFLGIPTAIETCGYFNWDHLQSVFHKLDFVFIDIKHMDSCIHKELTGAGNRVILENIKKIGKLRKPTVIRIPVIEGVNSDDRNIKRTAAFVKEFVPTGSIELLPYHSFGSHKYKDLGLEFPSNSFLTPSNSRLKELEKLIESQGVNLVSFK